MEIEAQQLEKAAYVFDTAQTKPEHPGHCERCTERTASALDAYCVPCALKTIREIAVHLRSYL